MKSTAISFFAAVTLALTGYVFGAGDALAEESMAENKPGYALAIHGGAGTILKKNMTPEKEAAYEAKLMDALKAGETVLASGGTALDAVVASIQVMEDSPLFNAGKGAVYTNAETNELDAAIMDGRDLNAGAVAGVTTVKSPIALARAVMERSPHVMLQSKGAEEFALEQGLEIVDPSYFGTKHRLEQLRRAKEQKSGAILDHDGYDDEFNDYKYGTVGAVALDRHGNLAAGTSTGGLTNKRWGRVGDVPIIGAGTYASNSSCAVSATGHGEYFIRATVGRSICALMEYKGLSLKEATHAIVMEQLVEMGGSGGIISVDPQGNIELVFNSAGMYRGSVREGGKPEVAIYGDE